MCPIVAFSLAALLVGTPIVALAAQEATPASDVPQLLADYGMAWSSGDPERVVARFTEDATFEEVILGGVVTRSHAELRAYAATLFAAFPDFALTPTSGFIAGDRAALEWVITATYAGQFGELPPGTGQSIELHGSSILELDADRIRRASEYWDAATLLAQVGVLPGAATPAA